MIGSFSTPQIYIPTYNNKRFTVALRNVVVGGSGSPIDRANIAILNVTRWIPINCVFRNVSQTGTLTTAAFALYTQASAAGTNIVAAAAISSLTTANTMQNLSVIATSGITDLNIFVRQTVDALLSATGVIDIFLDCLDIS